MNKLDSASRQWKNLFINPLFQLRFLSYFVGLFIISTASLYSTLYLFFWMIKDKAISVGLPHNHVFFKFLANEKSDLDILFIGLASFNFLLLIGIGFIISHRIAGPLDKLKNQLEQITDDSYAFKLRESDFFQELEPIVKKLKAKFQ